ncbi:MAG TPA: hypothetical protein PLA68_18055, partial [Panacibacter sp.]|nr:hypothetical protein [Panacibacter sp.]
MPDSFPGAIIVNQSCCTAKQPAKHIAIFTKNNTQPMLTAYTKLLFLITFIFILNACSTTNKVAQSADESFMIGDTLPDAPALSGRGEYKVGVRTLELVHKNQLDILHSKNGKDTFYDRHLKIEIWY